MWRVAITVLGLAAVAAQPTSAQDARDIARGKAYAERMCAECHAIERRDRSSPNPRAAPFPIIADTPGMTGTALAVWLRTPHPTMPNLIVDDGDLGDIIAYVLSLRSPR